MGVLVFLLVVLVGLSLMVGIYANAKGRSAVGFFFLSMLTSPIVGIIVAMIVRPTQKVKESWAIESGENRKCPFCAELVKSEAIVCKHCGRDLPPQDKVVGSPRADCPKTTEEYNRAFGIEERRP